MAANETPIQLANWHSEPFDYSKAMRALGLFFLVVSACSLIQITNATEYLALSVIGLISTSYLMIKESRALRPVLKEMSTVRLLLHRTTSQKNKLSVTAVITAQISLALIALTGVSHVLLAGSVFFIMAIGLLALSYSGRTARIPQELQLLNTAAPMADQMCDKNIEELQRALQLAIDLKKTQKADVLSLYLLARLEESEATRPANDVLA